MCQVDCNTAVCDFDKGECPIVRPLTECPSVECTVKVFNDTCDLRCFEDECLFGGGDCDLCRQEIFVLLAVLCYDPMHSYFRDTCPVAENEVSPQAV